LDVGTQVIYLLFNSRLAKLYLSVFQELAHFFNCLSVTLSLSLIFLCAFIFRLVALVTLFILFIGGVLLI